jgi:hypothetical protein
VSLLQIQDQHLYRPSHKFEPSSAPSLVQLETKIRQCTLKKGEKTGNWISELEDYRMRLEELGLSIPGNQFILHILNNMTDDYDLQLTMMEKRVMDKSNLLTFNEICDDLNLRFERLNEKQNEESENDNNQEVALLESNSKDNFEMVVYFDSQ